MKGSKIGEKAEFFKEQQSTCLTALTIAEDNSIRTPLAPEGDNTDIIPSERRLVLTKIKGIMSSTKKAVITYDHSCP
jgi:hypothetical protein